MDDLNVLPKRIRHFVLDRIVSQAMFHLDGEEHPPGGTVRLGQYDEEGNLVHVIEFPAQPEPYEIPEVLNPGLYIVTWEVNDGNTTQ